MYKLFFIKKVKLQNSYEFMHNTSIETKSVGRAIYYHICIIGKRMEKGKIKKNKKQKVQKKTICEAKKGNKKHKINISLKYLENFYIEKKFSFGEQFSIMQDQLVSNLPLTPLWKKDKG